MTLSEHNNDKTPSSRELLVEIALRVGKLDGRMGAIEKEVTALKGWHKWAFGALGTLVTIMTAWFATGG